MKKLLTVTAIIEFGAGIAMVAVPRIFTGLLFGLQIETLVAITVARLAGVAILALAIACWFMRNSEKSTATRGLGIALVLYNTGAAIILANAAFVLSQGSGVIWPVVLVHAAMAIWSSMSLKQMNSLKIK